MSLGLDSGLFLNRDTVLSKFLNHFGIVVSLAKCEANKPIVWDDCENE